VPQICLFDELHGASMRTCHKTSRVAFRLLHGAMLAVGMMLLGPAAARADDGLGFGTGIEYSTGKYGNTQSTDITYIPVTLSYATGRAAFSLTLSYISITGPGGVIQGFGRIASSSTPMGGGGGMHFGMSGQGSTQTTATNSGMGDVITSAAYRLSASESMSLDVVGKIKFGTADANKGLGTGKNDYAAQFDGHFRLGDADTLFATAGYKVVGAPEGIATNNVAYGTLGLDHMLDGDTRIGAMYNAAQSAFATGAALREVDVYVSQNVSNDMMLQFVLLKGLSDGSPDSGGKLLLSGRF
jgi:hypothetical protein